MVTHLTSIQQTNMNGDAWKLRKKTKTNSQQQPDFSEISKNQTKSANKERWNTQNPSTNKQPHSQSAAQHSTNKPTREPQLDQNDHRSPLRSHGGLHHLGFDLLAVARGLPKSNVCRISVYDVHEFTSSSFSCSSASCFSFLLFALFAGESFFHLGLDVTEPSFLENSRLGQEI